MGMKQRSSKVGAGVPVAGLLAVSGAVPAQALTDSGRQDCSAGGGYVGARGTQTWKADSVSLLLSGSNGYCYYPY